jgi:DNA-binding beta-propeller fold protein YncE
MSNDGTIEHSFGGVHPGSNDHFLDRPLHVAVDSTAKLIFVLDGGNRAVKVLKAPTLELVGVLFKKQLVKVDPRRMSIDCEGKQLVIASEEGHMDFFSYAEICS